MGYLQKIPFFLLLLVLFFCLHGSIENYGAVNTGEVFLLGLQIAAAGGTLFAVIYLFFRDFSITALLTFFIGLWYLFFGALQDWLKTIHALFFLQRYTYLLPALVLATVMWGIILKKKKQLRTKLFTYLNIVLLLYCIIDAGQLLTKYFAAPPKKANSIAFDYSKVQSKPNVYYLLFDEYPGYKSLKDSFGFANDSLYNFLQQQQFKMLPGFSNYNFTLFSMSAVFNMAYVDTAYNPLKLTEHDFQKRAIEIRNGQVFNIFTNMGYTIQNYSIFDVGNLSGKSDYYALIPVHAHLLTDKILHNRLFRTSGFLLEKFIPGVAAKRKKYFYQRDENNQYAAQMVKESAAAKNNTPKFCYAHFLMPHDPIYRDSNGNFNSMELMENYYKENNKPLYISYLKYTNSVIKSLVNSIIADDPKAIIVVMSDHGYRGYNNSKGFVKFQFNNICAVRTPESTEIPYKNEWSTINLFPYLFNKSYGQKIEYVQDRAVELGY